MKEILLLILCLIFGPFIQAQGFELPSHKKRDRIPFELVNNLVVIPVDVNGKELSFILDTGSRKTLLFSLTDIDSLEINDVTPIKIMGLGSEGLIDALRSENNTLRIGKATGTKQDLYIVFDKNVNISPKMGYPIHGVIGFDFLRDFVIEINYINKHLTFTKIEEYKGRECARCEQIPLKFNKGRPYVSAVIVYGNNRQKLDLLLDIGSSDALWLFNESWGIDTLKHNYFEDFLGTGISGSIHGKKSKLSQLDVGVFSFKDVKVSYPDEATLTTIRSLEDRNGSIGGEIFRRFHVTLIYANHEMILKKNKHYKDPFYYNMAGITLEHDGMVSVTGFENNGSVSLSPRRNRNNAGVIDIFINPTLSFMMAPRYVVAELRKNSPAAMAGIQVGDVVISINGKESYKYKLYEVNSLFSRSKEGKKMTLLINRNGYEIEYSFKLKKVL